MASPQREEANSAVDLDPMGTRTICFVDGARKGRKILLYDGHIFYFHSRVKQSTYFKCSFKQKGCTASITVKNWNKEDSSFESYLVTKKEHVNHLPNSEELLKKKEKSRLKEKMTVSSNVDTELLKNRRHVCLFCFATLPLGYQDVTSLENVMPSGHILSIPLDDPVKNSQSFDLLCSLLQVKWKSSRGDGEHFNQRKSLPLCFKCQNLYQEMIQVHQQIRELEVLLNKFAKIIRQVIGRSEEEDKNAKAGVESTQLGLLGLDVFRYKVVERFKTYREDASASFSKLLPDLHSSSKRAKPSSPKTDDPFLQDIPSNHSVVIKQEILEVDQALNEVLENMEPSMLEDFGSLSPPQMETNQIKDGFHRDPGGSDRNEHVNRNLRARSTRIKPEKNIADEEYSPSSVENEMRQSDDNYSALSDSNDDGDSDFEVKKEPFSKRQGLRRVPSNSLSRYRKKLSAASSSSSNLPKKVNTCHICSFRVRGHKAFWNHYKVEHPDERRYSCKFCKKHYIRLRDVIVHQRTHTGEKPFTCHSCPLAYVSRSLLRLHIIRCHTEAIYPCSQCDKEFNSKTILNNHLTAVHGQEPKSQLYKKSKKPIKTMTCHLCDAQFLGAGPFIQHYKDIHPEEKRFTCKFCGRHFPYIRRVLFHQRTHTGEKPIPCEECGKSFINAAGLRYHRATRHVSDGDKVYACPICPKRYSLKASLTGHMYSHREYFVVCKSCGKVFRTHCSFHKHNRLFHESKAECTQPMTNPSKEALDSLGISAGIKCRKKCHVCMAPIPGKIFIQKHFEECHPDHPGDYMTCRCGQQFGSYKEVWKHAIRKHADNHEKPYQCDQCPYSCLTSTELKSHSITHIPVEERQKTHICDICGLGCASQSTLAQHMKKHQEGSQTKYVCELCGKSYVEKRGLHQHKKTNHWKILPHKCHFEGCGKAFPLRSILLRHLNVHTGEKMYKCEDCGKNFHYSNSLARHRKEVHDAGGEDGQTPRKRKVRKTLTSESVESGSKEEGAGGSAAVSGSLFGGGLAGDPEVGMAMDYRNLSYRHHHQMNTFLGGFGAGIPSVGMVGHHEMKPENE